MVCLLCLFFIMNPMTLNKKSLADRSIRLIYKDLIKTVKITMDAEKQKAVLLMIRSEFDKGRRVTEPKEVEAMKINACNAISNLYITHVKDKLVDSKSTKTNRSNGGER